MKQVSIKQYWLVLAEAVPYMCNGITANIVVSEPPVSLLHRMMRLKEDGTVKLLYWSKISRFEYNLLRPYNPTREGYFKLSLPDYGEKL